MGCPQSVERRAQEGWGRSGPAAGKTLESGLVLRGREIWISAAKEPPEEAVGHEWGCGLVPSELAVKGLGHREGAPPPLGATLPSVQSGE